VVVTEQQLAIDFSTPPARAHRGDPSTSHIAARAATNSGLAQKQRRDKELAKYRANRDEAKH